MTDFSSLQLFTSESVTEGHPDKVCDRISDAILDALLESDPQSRVAVETLAAKGLIHVAGEVTTSAYVDIDQIARDEVLQIGYDSSKCFFDGRTCGVIISIGQQSPDISAAVSTSLETRTGTTSHDDLDTQGAGDQGIMFGYACDETPDYMPAPIWLAHKLARRLTDVRKQGVVEGFFPDGKTQVTLGYDGDRPVALHTVLVSTQHSEDLSLADVQNLVRTHVIDPVINDCGLDLDTSDVRYQINPSGKFVVGGPAGDCGLTGRKLIVDTYGGMARHGGGALSGKDPSKVDRSAAYALRWIAKHVVASGAARRCELQVSYAIGSAHPISLWVDTFGTAAVSESQIVDMIQEVFDLRPAAIVRDLDLLRPIYKDASTYGHFGREQFPWEQLSRLDEVKKSLNLD